MGMHVERIDREVVSRQVEGLEDLTEGQVRVVTIDDNFL